MSDQKQQYIDGRWCEGDGEPLVSIDPATGEACWSGRAACVSQASAAVTAAHAAAAGWSTTEPAKRVALLERFREQLVQHHDALADTIRRETGKARWEAKGEVDAMIGKIPITLDAWRQRQQTVSSSLDNVVAVTRYKPLGALLVFGPFNFPGHIPNGHIAPALLAGNTVVFKPSELTPMTACHTIALWEAAGAPPGVINLVQGGPAVGKALVDHNDHRGVLFTGSFRTGIALRRALVERPDAMLALEMGGNNPLVVHDVTDVEAAAYWTVVSAFITAGQRCTCARRLIVTDTPQRQRFLDRLATMTRGLRVAAPDAEPQPFFGPMITADAARRVKAAHDALVARGGVPLVAMQALDQGPGYVSPGIVDVTDIQREDVEVFGPLLQVVRVDKLDDAIDVCNDTDYGLAAALFSEDRDAFEHFYCRLHAGVINWNRPTTGASGRLPFGGVGQSGNHRPSGFFAIDYCADPVSSLQSDALVMPDKSMPGVVL